jgi:hypothetical protein
MVQLWLFLNRRNPSTDSTSARQRSVTLDNISPSQYWMRIVKLSLLLGLNESANNLIEEIDAVNGSIPANPTINVRRTRFLQPPGRRGGWSRNVLRETGGNSPPSQAPWRLPWRTPLPHKFRQPVFDGADFHDIGIGRVARSRNQRPLVAIELTLNHASSGQENRIAFSV